MSRSGAIFQILNRGLLVGILAVCSSASNGSASDLRLSWKNPCYNARADSCALETADSLKDLSFVRLTVVRFTHPDTLTFDIQANNRACDTMSVVLDIDPGTMGTVTAAARDFNGHESCGPSSLVFAVPAVDILPGLVGNYYDNVDLTGFKFSEVDPVIDYDWDLATPDPRLGADTFSIRWTGFITPPVTGTYQFFGRIEDGYRLWVGPTWVVSDWGVQPEHESSGYATLQAGVRYTFKMEYTANNGTAMVRLSWLPPNGIKVVVPSEAFSH